jgi:hypothetical protein
VEGGALRMRDEMSRWNPLWRTVTVLVRLDIAAGIFLAAGLRLWLTWH